MIKLTKEDLDQFEKPFHELLDDMARRIKPKESKRINRKGLGKAIDVAILLRRGFEQSWQFIVIIQALFVFLGLSPQVSNALAQLGIHVSGTAIGLIAISGIIFFFAFGMALLLYGGTQRSTALITSKQNPAMRLNYHFYRTMARWAKKQDEKIDSLQEKIDEVIRERDKN